MSKSTAGGGVVLGLKPMLPKGAYYIMCDIGSWGYPNDVEFSRFLVKDIGVATVPGSSFYRNPEAGKDIIRFTFCKKEETLRAAEERLTKLNQTGHVASKTVVTG